MRRFQPLSVEAETPVRLSHERGSGVGDGGEITHLSSTGLAEHEHAQRVAARGRTSAADSLLAREVHDTRDLVLGVQARST